MSIRWLDGRQVKRRDRRHLLMKMGYSVYHKVRGRIAQDSNWKCDYCGSPVALVPDDPGKLATIDHRIPGSRGGTWKKYNLACACKQCNEEKCNMTDEEYRYYLILIGRRSE